MTDYTTKIAELQADVQTIWKLQCQNLYNSKNLGALAVRECLQNSIDAIKKAIKLGQIYEWEGRIDIKYDETSTVTIEDNGCGMDIKTIHNKFLKLGGTTKGDEDSVGGFGLAKAVILGCGSGFEIWTQDNYLSSADLGQNPISKKTFRQGTKIVLKDVQTSKSTKVGDDLDKFKYSILEYILSSDIPYTVKVNGVEYKNWFEKSRKTYRSPATFDISSDMIPDKTKLRIDVYKKDNDYSKYLYVRLRGLTQFKQYLGWNANCDIVLDFQCNLDPRSTEYPFATNREGLKAHYQGITEAIRDKVTKAPISISANDDYKETYFENRNSSVKKEREISAFVASKDITEIVKTVSKVTENIDGMQAQGGYTEPSIVDRAKQYQEQIEDLAKLEGKTVEQFVKTMDKMHTLALNNPLEYSWLIWKDKDYEGRGINKNKAVEIILIWDSILRIMANRYSDMCGKVFYPGIIIKDDTLGMCVEKTVPTGERRHYIMINPFKCNIEDDTQLTLYLMGVAAHELAHFVCNSYEAHGETFSYTREAIMNNSLCELNNILSVVKGGKLRKKLANLVKTNESKKLDDCGINFKEMSTQEIKDMATEYGVDIISYEDKYDSSESILRMRLIMAIKKKL